MPIIYSARWVLPIATPLIEDGAVAVDNSLIVAVGPRSEIVSKYPQAPIEEFGEGVILPGFVNAHSHLELTVMRGFLEREESDFSAWLRKLTVARMTMTPADLLVSATCGAIEAARTGVTCLADASSLATEPMKALREVGLRGIVYHESFGPDPNLAGENMTKLREEIAGLREHETNLVRAGVSPHAPYTVSAPQLEMIARMAIDQRLPVMMHAAESQAEKLLLIEGSGVFADKLMARGIQWRAPGISTIQYLARHGIMDTRPLLAHCINVDEADLDLILRSGAGVAHCPRSNAKLGHGRAPFAQFISRGINAGLGSDSVASNNNCDILEEARFATLLSRVPSHSDNQPVTDSVSADQALFAATLGGARALKIDDQVGALAPGMQADIAVISLNGAHQQPMSDPASALVFSSSGRDVVLTVVAGKEIYRDGRLPGVDETQCRARLEQVRTKIDLATGGLIT